MSKYIRNLIPPDAKVLPEYFKGNSSDKNEEAAQASVVGYLGALLFFAIAVANISHLLMALIFALIGFILLPQGQAWFERALDFKLKPKIKVGACVILCLLQIPVASRYRSVEADRVRQQEVEQANALRLKQEQDRKEQQRTDSLTTYITLAAEVESNNGHDSALKLLDHAQLFTSTTSERDNLASRKEGIGLRQISDYMDKGEYALALDKISQVSSGNTQNTDVLYNRALCNSKLGNIAEAVSDLKQAISLGSSKAEQLHEQINPIKRRVLYYQTMCCDGTPSPSNAKGRGACSHHGGVCNWNEPVYEEYRKY